MFSEKFGKQVCLAAEKCTMIYRPLAMRAQTQGDNYFSILFFWSKKFAKIVLSPISGDIGKKGALVVGGRGIKVSSTAALEFITAPPIHYIPIYSDLDQGARSSEFARICNAHFIVAGENFPFCYINDYLQLGQLSLLIPHVFKIFSGI